MVAGEVPLNAAVGLLDERVLLLEGEVLLETAVTLLVGEAEPLFAAAVPFEAGALLLAGMVVILRDAVVPLEAGAGDGLVVDGLFGLVAPRI